MSTAMPAWTQQVPATFEGLAGKVWEVTGQPPADDPRVDAKIGSPYVIFAPGAHPLWSWHLMVAIALRDLPGVPPSTRHYPEAQYELVVLALHPDHEAPDPRHWPLPGVKHLEPPDVVTQFHGVTDEQAAEILVLCAQACADGILIPDEDHRATWHTTVGATVEHYQPGGHGPPPPAPTPTDLAALLAQWEKIRPAVEADGDLDNAVISEAIVLGRACDTFDDPRAAAIRAALRANGLP